MALLFRLTEGEKTLINFAFQRYHDLRVGTDSELTDFKLAEKDEKLRKSFALTSLHQPSENVRAAYKFHSKATVLLTNRLVMYLRSLLFESECGETFEIEIPCEQPFKPLQSFFSFDEYQGFMYPPFKNRLKQMRLRERLPWVINLLIDYHYGHECSMYISLALKLSLRAFYLIIYSFAERIMNYRDFSSFSFFLRDHLIVNQRYKCDELLVATALDVFWMNSEQRESFFKYVPDLKYVLESISRTTLKLPFQLNKERPGKFDCFDLCLIINLHNFVVLVTFGASSNYSKEDWLLFKWRGIEAHDEKVINHNPFMPVYGRCSLRLSQIVYLFKKSEKDQETFDKVKFVLKLLWESIHEPFITEEDVTKYLKEPIRLLSLCNRKCFLTYFYLYHTLEDYPDTIAAESLYKKSLELTYDCQSTVRNIPPLDGTPEAATVVQAWQWYKEIVLNGDSPLSSPRSLKHLCRCVIRQNLAMNFLLPRGVHLLNLPDPINNYLLMKDCGDNPYENIQDSVLHSLT